MISLAAPIKVEPLSLQIRLGFPLLAINLLRQAMNASVVRSDTTSRWTALTVKETKTQIYNFTMVGFRVCPSLVSIGPA